MKLFHFDSDASVMEKIVETLAPIFVLILILFMNIWGWGIGHNCYAQSCSHYGFLWHFVGLCLSIYGLYFFWRSATDRSTLNIPDSARIVFTGLLFVFSFLSYSGFSWYFNVCQ